MESPLIRVTGLAGGSICGRVWIWRSCRATLVLGLLDWARSEGLASDARPQILTLVGLA